MRIIFSFILFNFYCISSFGKKYILDSTETHSYIKLTSYPFLYPKENTIDGSFAIGPSASVSAEHFEIQVGILYDVQKYKAILYNGHFAPSTHVEYRNLYFPLTFNYYFRITNKLKCFASLGGGFVVPNYNDSQVWGFAGGGVSYKASENFILNLNIHERLGTGGLSQGVFFEIAYRINNHKSL